VEARSNIAELAAQMQRLPDPDEPIRRIDAAAKAESRERTPEEQAQIRAIEARPETVSQRVARNKLDHRIGLTINRDLKPAYIRASLISIEGFEVEGQPAMAKPWESLLRYAPDELIDELYVAANLNSGLTTDQEKNSQSPSPSPAVEDGRTRTTWRGISYGSERDRLVARLTAWSMGAVQILQTRVRTWVVLGEPIHFYPNLFSPPVNFIDLSLPA
jgi:hypothetical protein